MKSIFIGRWITVVCPGLMLLGLLCLGCGKEEAPPPAAAAPVEAVAPPPESAPEPAYDQPVPAADDAQAQMQQVDTRLQSNDYEGAVDALLRAQIAAQQQQTTTAQQRVDQHNRMRLVQKQIADAMASGDPNAQRAARLLMQYNAAQTQR